MAAQTTTVHEASDYATDVEGEQLIAGFFRDFGMARMVDHQLHSYNYFVKVLGPRVITSQTIHCKSDDIKGELGLVGNRRCSYLEANVRFSDVVFVPPKHMEPNGAEHWLFPYDARLRHLHYKSQVSANMHIHMIEHNDRAEVVDRHDITVRVPIMKLPVMVKSVLCNLTRQVHNTVHENRECIHDPGTYFITKGVEKELNPNERPKENGPIVSAVPDDVQSKFSWKLEIRSLAENGLSAPKLLELYVLRRRGVRGHPLRVFVSKLDKHVTIPLFAVFYAMGAANDEEIFHYILRMTEPDHPENQLFLPYLLASRDEITGKPVHLRNDFVGETMQLKACDYISTLVSYKPEREQRNEQVIERRRLWYSQQLVNDDFFPNVPRIPAMRMYALGFHVRKLLAVATGLTPPDNRDAYPNKRIDLPGVTINNLLRSLLMTAMKMLQRNINRELRAARRNGVPLRSILTPAKINKVWNVDIIDKPFQRAFSTGDFSTTPTATNKIGLAQQTQRTSQGALIAQTRKINTPLDKNGEMITPRRLHPTTLANACPADTPENNGLGLVKSMALTAHITLPTWSEPVLQLIRPHIVPLSAAAAVGESPWKPYADDQVKVIVNGAWIGVVSGVDRVDALVRLLRHRKRVGYLSRYISIVFDVLQRELRIGTDGGRICRPLLIVENGRLRLTREVLARLASRELSWDDLFDYHCDPEHGGVMEYLDVEEQTMTMIALASRPVDRATLCRFQYAEIHPTFVFGFMMNLIPFPERNPAIRNGYQNSMGKQANGLFATNVEYRMDKSANVCLTSDRPLLTTMVYEATGLNRTAAGNMVTIALLSDDGNNQEDSITANQACFDRGLFNTVVYNTFRSESDKKVATEKNNIIKPTQETTIQMKAANYDRVNELGFINVNQYVGKSDIILLRINKIPKSRLEGVVAAVKASRRPAMRAAIQNATAAAAARGASAHELTSIGAQIQREFDCKPTPIYEDHSVGYYHEESAAVDRNFRARDSDNVDFSKTTLRKIRPPTMGDKFNTRCGQKGTLSVSRRDVVMPYFVDDGSSPDILMNPHCMPSRMSGELTIEMWLTRLLVELGYFGNGTAHASLDMKRVARLLARLGLHPHGERWMVDGRTGRMMRATVFGGMILEDRLRHMVIDKEHCRDEGQMVKLTRQPSEGRARDGGFKVGEMEKDNMLAHGACGLLYDRMYRASDAFQIYVCRDCGILAVGNSGEERGMPFAVKSRFYCRICGSGGEFVRVKLPFCFWLTIQEFEMNNLCMQFVFDNTVQQTHNASIEPTPAAIESVSSSTAVEKLSRKRTRATDETTTARKRKNN